MRHKPSCDDLAPFPLPLSPPFPSTSYLFPPLFFCLPLTFIHLFLFSSFWLMCYLSLSFFFPLPLSFHPFFVYFLPLPLFIRSLTFPPLFSLSFIFAYFLHLFPFPLTSYHFSSSLLFSFHLSLPLFPYSFILSSFPLPLIFPPLIPSFSLSPSLPFLPTTVPGNYSFSFSPSGSFYASDIALFFPLSLFVNSLFLFLLPPFLFYLF